MVSVVLLALCLEQWEIFWQLGCVIFYSLISLIQMGEQLGSHHLGDNCLLEFISLADDML